MTETRIDTDNPLIQLQAIEKQIGRRRLVFGGQVVLKLANHVALSQSTLTLSAGGQLLEGVVLAPTAATITTFGNTVQFAATAIDQSAKPLKIQPVMGWSASNPAVATVDQTGLVRAQTTNGVSTITAFVAGQPNRFAVAAVTVTASLVVTNHVTVSPKAVTLVHQTVTNTVPQNLAVVPNGATVQLGSTLTLGATVTNAQGQGLTGFSPTWDSDDPTIATVDKNTGIVTPVALGTCTVYGAVVDQGTNTQAYAATKATKIGFSVNVNYARESPYQGLYPQNFTEMSPGGRVVEEAAFETRFWATGASGTTVQFGAMVDQDAQMAKFASFGLRPIMYLLGGDSASGDAPWMGTAITDAASAQSVMYQMIDFMTGRYPGQQDYVLFNEWMKSFGGLPSYTAGGYSDNLFIKYLGSSYTSGFWALAAQRIRLKDPLAKIWCNTNHCETDSSGDTTNWSNVLSFLTGIKNAGTPIDGFSFESHLVASAGAATYTKIRSRVASVRALGLLPAIGELDVTDDTSLNTGTAGIPIRDALHAKIRKAYRDQFYADGPPDHDIEWQDSDQTSWLDNPPNTGTPYDRLTHTSDGQQGRPCARDAVYVAKPSYRAKLASLGGPVGSSAITVVAASIYNEPSGMTTVINTGNLTVAPASAPNTQWTNGLGTFTGFSPVGAKGTDAGVGSGGGHYEVMGNLYLCPDGPGYRMFYPPQLPGGYSPVRFASTSFSSGGTGTYYMRVMRRMDPAYSSNGNRGTKFVFIKSSGSSQNNYCSGDSGSGNLIDAWASGTQQVPFANTYVGTLPAANDAGGAWHLCELLWIAEGTAGQNTGTLKLWVDSTLVVNVTNAGFFNSGDTKRFTSLFWDPTFGGGSHSPLSPGTYQDFNLLYASVK